MNPQGFNPNSLYYGDCLNWIREWEPNCVDLIYLDPPFNSSANYNVLFGAAGNGEAQYRAFNDTWHWDAAASARYQEFQRSIKRPAHDAIVGLHRMLGNCGMLAYLTYMAERLEEMGARLETDRLHLPPLRPDRKSCAQTAHGRHIRSRELQK